MVKDRSRISSYLVFILAALIGAGLFYAHIEFTRLGENYRGATLIFDRIFDITLALGLTGVCFAIGRKSARLLSIEFANVAEELSFSIMIGVGILGLLILGLGLAGLLTPLPVVLVIVLLIIPSWREGETLLTAIERGIAGIKSTRFNLLFTLLFVTLIFILALRTLTPPHTPDEAIYHLSVTKLFVERGRVFPVTDNWAGNMPFLIQMIYAICLIAKSDIAAKLFSLCLAVVCSLALYGFSLRFLTRRVGLFAMFGFFATGMVVEVAITSRIDVSLAGMLFLAAYAMMTYFETRQKGWLYASAMLSGFSLGIKYSAGIYIILLGVMYLVESFTRGKDGALTIIKRGIIYSAILAALASPWFIKNFIWFGNPVYPFVTGEVAELAPGQVRYFNADDQAKLDAHYARTRSEMPELVRQREIEMARAASRRVSRHPLRFWEYFTKSDTYNMAENFHYPNYLFLFAPLFVFVGRVRWLIWLGIFSLVFFLAAIQTSWIARLLLPTYPALTLISAYTIIELTARTDWAIQHQSPYSRKKWISTIALACTLGPTILLSLSQYKNSNDLNFTTGAISRTDYMRNFYYYPPSYFINNSTPEGSRVMLIGAQTCYDLKRDYIADVNWDSTEWRRLLIRNKSLEELNQDMKGRGVNYIWVAYGLFTFVAEMGRENYPNISGLPIKAGPDYQAQLMNWAILELYSSKFLDQVYSDKFGNVIYKIR